MTFRKVLWAMAACIALLAAFPILYSVRAGHAKATAAAPAVPKETEEKPDAVSCLGRIEPEGDVIRLAAPYVLGRPPVVESLHVKEGAHVNRGLLLATLAGREQLEAAVDAARAQTVVARRRLDQVRAGPKNADISAQQAEIARLEVNLDNLQTELRRAEALRSTDDVTESEVDAKRTAVLSTKSAVDQARQRLESLRDIPAGEIHVAEAQVDAASSEEARARRDYDMSAVYAPVDGDVLKVHAHTGEEIGAKGLLEIGRLDHMCVVAEVYETDISRVRPGQRAMISGDMLAHPVSGTVERVGRKVLAPSVLSGDPASFSDNRVVEARIRLDQSDAVAGLIDGKVSVVIQP